MAENPGADEAPAAVKTLFISEQRKPLHRSTVNLLLTTASHAASLPFSAHPHMLHHACLAGFGGSGISMKS